MFFFKESLTTYLVSSVLAGKGGGEEEKDHGGLRREKGKGRQVGREEDG